MKPMQNNKFFFADFESKEKKFVKAKDLGLFFIVWKFLAEENLVLFMLTEILLLLTSFRTLAWGKKLLKSQKLEHFPKFVNHLADCFATFFASGKSNENQLSWTNSQKLTIGNQLADEGVRQSQDSCLKNLERILVSRRSWNGSNYHQMT